jgi:uncharacterized membrane protein
MMQGNTLVLVLGAVTFSTVGQLLLKAGARHLAGLGRVEFLFAAARDIHVISGVAAWGASTVCWLYVLRGARLSSVYGLNSLTYVLVPLASVYFFDERVRQLQVVGIALILAGIACVLSAD